MSTFTIGRPATLEYDPHYQEYISKVPEGNIMTILRDQLDEAQSLFNSIPEEKGEFRYEPGKWTIKEVIGHINDTERIMAYRALRIARNDKTPLPGFEQDDYMPYGFFNQQPIGLLGAEFSLIRNSNILMLDAFTEHAWKREGTASDRTVSVRALAYILAGHFAHHTQILRGSYL